MSTGHAYRGSRPNGAGRYHHSSSRSSARSPSSRAGRRQLRRRRLAGTLRLAVFLLLIFIAVWAGVRVAHAGEDARVFMGHEYVVRSGDTLWSIAGQEYGAEIDLRGAVHDIRVANQLEGSILSPGDVLTLPYEGE